jgi:hypothetical protein
MQREGCLGTLPLVLGMRAGGDFLGGRSPCRAPDCGRSRDYAVVGCSGVIGAGEQAPTIALALSAAVKTGRFVL